MIIRSILNLWWHSEILKLILGVVRGMFTKRLKGTRQLLYTVKSDFFEMTALHSKCYQTHYPYDDRDLIPVLGYPK